MEKVPQRREAEPNNLRSENLIWCLKGLMIDIKSNSIIYKMKPLTVAALFK